MPRKVWDEITYPFINFNCATVVVSEWISNFIPHFIMDVITYPCWDLSQTMLVKGVAVELSVTRQYRTSQIESDPLC